MKNSRFSKIKKHWEEFWEEENAEEYTGDTVGMYIGGTNGTLLVVAMILYGGMEDEDSQGNRMEQGG